MKYLVVQAFWYFDQVTGEFTYRIKNPGDTLAAHPEFDVINIHVFHPLFAQLAIAADVLVLHLLPDEEVFRIIWLRRQARKPTIFEIADNFLSLGDWVAEDDAYRNPRIRQNFLYYASLCDGLWFSTGEVCKTFGFLNNNHLVLENQSTHFSEKRRPLAPFVIGWGGSKGHEKDLAEIAPTLIDFCSRHDDVLFHYMGFPPIYERHFGGIPRGRGKCTPAGPIEDYFDFLGNIHVGLAPLGDTEFNRCRSDVKFLEYASHSVVPVLADAAPYRAHGRHGQNCLIYKSPEELAAILEDLYRDREKTRALSSAAYAYARSDRCPEANLEKQVIFLKALLKHEPQLQQSPQLPDCSGLVTYLRRATHEYTLEQYSEAVDILDKVLSMHPQYQLAHAWRAKCMIAMGRFEAVLQKYAAFHLDQVYFDLFLECLTVAAQRLQNPLWREFHKLIANPTLKHLLDEELAREPEKQCRAILASNPFHYDSLVNLAQMLAAQKNPESAALYGRIRFLAPESGDLQ